MKNRKISLDVRSNVEICPVMKSSLKAELNSDLGDFILEKEAAAAGESPWNLLMTGCFTPQKAARGYASHVAAKGIHMARIITGCRTGWRLTDRTGGGVGQRFLSDVVAARSGVFPGIWTGSPSRMAVEVSLILCLKGYLKEVWRL